MFLPSVFRISASAYARGAILAKRRRQRRSASAAQPRPCVPQAEGVGLVEELDAGFALDAASHHCVAQLGVGEERPGRFHRVELVDDQHIVGISGQYLPPGRQSRDNSDSSTNGRWSRR